MDQLLGFGSAVSAMLALWAVPDPTAYRGQYEKLLAGGKDRVSRRKRADAFYGGAMFPVRVLGALTTFKSVLPLSGKCFLYRIRPFFPTPPPSARPIV